MASSRTLNRFVKRLTSAIDSAVKFFRALKPDPERTVSPRMCPSCGLITPRFQEFCLECGKPLEHIPLERRHAR